MKQELPDTSKIGPKKVLFLITKSNWGGAQRYVYDLAANLDRAQFEAVVALGGTGASGAGPGLLKSRLDTAGVRTILIPSFMRDVSLRQEFHLWRDLTQLMIRERPDVIHLNSSKAGAWGAFVAFMTGMPRVVFTVHGWPFKERRDLFATLVIKLLSWFTAVMSDAVIVVSHDDERIGRGMPFISKKIRYIPLGIQSPDFLPRNQAAEIIPHPNIQWPRTVTIAELTKNKGIPLAIEALALLKKRGVDVSYSIIGDGEDRTRLQKLIEERNLSDRVRLLGFVKDASRYLKAFDIFLLSSLKEGLPYVLLEAGLAGIPVVASKVGGIPDLIKDRTTGFLVDPRNISEFADRIATCATDTTTGPAYAAALKRRIEADFSLENMVGVMSALYLTN